jgi:hypothetical protein
MSRLTYRVPALFTSPNKRCVSDPGASLDKSALLPLSRRSRKYAVFYTHSLRTLFRQLIASGLLISGCAASQVNIYMAGVFHSVLQPRPEMFACKTFFVALAILWSIVDMTSYDPSPCSEPAVRREWRVFSAEENAEWIRVVNVRNDTPLKLVALLKQYLQHNPVLVKIAS